VYPNLILTQPKLVIIFFHDIVSRKNISNAWKETWTSITHINGEERPTFWIKEWLVEDMGEKSKSFLFHMLPIFMGSMMM
jgi:hypothetical protein